MGLRSNVVVFIVAKDVVHWTGRQPGVATRAVAALCYGMLVSLSPVDECIIQ